MPLLEAMRWGYLGRLAKYRAQAGNAQVLLKGLHEDGVEPLILEGGDVRHHLYDDPATRPMPWVGFFLKVAAAFGVQGPMWWILQRMEQLRPGVVPPAVQRQLTPILLTGAID